MASTSTPSGSSNTVIPKLRFKRNNQHLSASSAEDTESEEASPVGQFKALPTEIFHLLLDYLSGLLMKRSTLLLPTRERLKYIHKTISHISCFRLCACPTPSQCVGPLCYGALLKVLTAGWDEQECHKVFFFISALHNLPQKMKSLVSGRPGSSYRVELCVRLFCRHVLLDHWTHRNDSAFWLTRLLKPWPIVNQARLLYIFYGPVSTIDGHVAWQRVTEDIADENNLKELADAIKLLYATSKEWTVDSVISLVDELTEVPSDWLMENNARLLILCGNTICFTYMASRAVNGRTADVARRMVFLALVCEKDHYCMAWAVNIMQRICNVFNTQVRKTFLENVENSFSGIMMDLLQSTVAGVRNDEVSFHNMFHLISAQANFHKEILYLTINVPSA
ncbi:F-box only protein 47 isoform X2 [Dendropsophus ebraccatus]|uniref:F-box only protein 47 isoform X2 n=1 Tax=Dendropsophus ebraccatus TaxID=150705 RepID=UPI003831ED2D